MTDKLETTSKDTALTTLPDDLLRDAGKGTENISDDIKPPRIILCQSGTPQRKPGNIKQIPGLNELDMFNDLSEEIYGQGPLRIVVIRVLPQKGIQFAPMEEGGGVIDFDVPWNDPRMQFTTDEDGTRRKPVATLFREFLVWLPEQQEPAVISMKSTQLRAAEQLQRKIKLPLKGELIHPSLKGQVLMDPPAWARTYSLKAVMQEDAKKGYAWANYALRLEGVTPVEVRETCSKLADVYAKKNIIVEREADEDDTFDPVELEAQATAGAGGM